MRLNDGAVLSINASQQLLVENRAAEALGRRVENGSPLFWRHLLGEGAVVVMAVPLEVSLTTTPGAFADDAAPFWRVYAALLPARGQRVPPTDRRPAHGIAPARSRPARARPAVRTDPRAPAWRITIRFTSVARLTR